MSPDRGTGTVQLRLLRSDDIPATNPHNLAFKFGLQDKKQNIFPGRPLRNGILAFDFTLTVKEGKNLKQPVFAGPFVNGPADDRFVYLSWWAIRRGDYINRVKARLGTIDWKLVLASQKQRRPITADMTGWLPGDVRRDVDWYLG